MKGTPKTSPNNHVEWDNGFKSNMPDWTTARHAAHADDLLFWLKQARTVLLTIQRPGAFVDTYDQEKCGRTIDGIAEVLSKADGMSAIVESFKDMLPLRPTISEIETASNPILQPFPAFPKPPGVK